MSVEGGTVQANGSGEWRYTVGTALQDGLRVLTAKQLDAAGNESAASNALNVTVDSLVAAPALTSTNAITANPMLTGNGEAGATVDIFDTAAVVTTEGPTKNLTGKLSSTAATGVGNVNDAGQVSIIGAAEVGNTLNAVVTDLDGLSGVTVSYQWMADGVNISGATSANLLLTSAQADKAISVKATYTDALGGVEAPVSNATAAVPIALTSGVSETVVINTDNPAVNTHTVKGFELWDGSSGDKLNLSNLLQGYTPGTSDLTQWVTKSFANGNTSLVVDLDGTGINTTTQTIVLQGVDWSALDLTTLKSSGVIVA